MALFVATGGSASGAPPTTIDEETATAIEAGYLALCVDGTFSGEINLSETCFLGGGVDHWLTAQGRCADGRLIVMAADATCLDDEVFESLVLPSNCVIAATVQLGSSGPDVECLELRLTQFADDPSLMVADSVFDELTDSAVRAFQEANDLDADGVVGPQTATQLGIWPIEVPSSQPIPQIQPAVAQSSNVYYENCDAASDAGAAPLSRDDPGYRPALDGDDDGVACESG